MLRVKNINKTFPGVRALNNVNIDIRDGEVLAIVGENGAGKTTLMNIIMGIISADDGELFINEKKVYISNPSNALALGISMIFQDINLIPELNIAENIYTGRLPKLKNSPWIDWKKMLEETKKILEYLGLDIKPTEKVSSLTIGQRQILQVGKVVSSNSNIIIMDEPTASLSEVETKKLFNIIKELKLQKKSVIYISHRLEEVFNIADRVTVLRNGEVVDTLLIKEATKEKLISLMVGGYLKKLYKEKKHVIGGTALRLENFTKLGVFENVNLSLKSGEILGLYGLVGAGRTELALSIFGILPISSGKLYFKDKKIKINSPIDAIKNGIGYLPEERIEQSIISMMSVKENITISNLKKYCDFIFTNAKKEKEIADYYIKRLNIKITSIAQKMMNLSGGNQQKVAFARLLALNPMVLILDEPTRGIDVGAKAQIHAIIGELAENGIGVIIISSELPEIIEIANRIIVMRLGKVSGSFVKDEKLTQKDLLKAASPV